MADEENAKAFTRIFWDIIADDATGGEIRDASYAAAELAVTMRQQAISELVEAIRFTVEYIGTDALPPLPGWSYYDALKKYAPEVAQQFVDQDHRYKAKENN